MYHKNSEKSSTFWKNASFFYTKVYAITKRAGSTAYLYNDFFVSLASALLVVAWALAWLTIYLFKKVLHFSSLMRKNSDVFIKTPVDF